MSRLKAVFESIESSNTVECSVVDTVQRIIEADFPLDSAFGQFFLINAGAAFSQSSKCCR